MAPIAGESMVECPYNKSHLISAARMQFHLVKCRKASGEETRTCPFNGQHHVRNLDYHEHVRTCADRSTVVSFLANSGDQASAIADYVRPDLPEDDENWDDGEAPTYDPHERTEKEAVFRVLMGATKSQRKNFRKDERERYNRLRDGPKSVDSVPGYTPEEPETFVPVLKIEKKECFETGKALRQPKARSETFAVPPDYMDKVGQGRGKNIVSAPSSGLVNRIAEGNSSASNYAVDGSTENEPFQRVTNSKKKRANGGPVPAAVGPVVHPRAEGGAAFTAAFNNLAVGNDHSSTSRNDDVWSGLPLTAIPQNATANVPIPDPNFNLDFPVLNQGRGRGRHINNTKKH